MFLTWQNCYSCNNEPNLSFFLRTINELKIIEQSVENKDLKTIKFYLIDQCYAEKEFISAIYDILNGIFENWDKNVTHELWSFVKHFININENPSIIQKNLFLVPMLYLNL